MIKTKVANCIYWFDTGIFNGTVMFVYRYSYDELITELKKKKAGTWAIAIEYDRELITKADYLAMRRCLTNKKTGKEIDHFIIYINAEFRFTDYDFCKLAHECLHICQYFLPDILNREKEHEAEAYFHTYLMQKCLAALRGK